MTSTADTPGSSPSPVPSPMRRYAAIGLVLVGLIALAFLVWPKSLYRPSTPREKAIQTVMMSDLLGLPGQEAIFYKINGRFTAGSESTFFLRSIGVTTPSITVTDSGWYASVTHAQLPGVTCAIAVATKNPLHQGAPNGTPVCK